MSELFDDEEDKVLVAEDEIIDTEDVVTDAEDVVAEVEDILEDDQSLPATDARRRLESLLEEKRLRDELEDFLDF